MTNIDLTHGKPAGHHRLLHIGGRDVCRGCAIASMGAGVATDVAMTGRGGSGWWSMIAVLAVVLSIPDLYARWGQVERDALRFAAGLALSVVAWHVVAGAIHLDLPGWPETAAAIAVVVACSLRRSRRVHR